jgi:hypothetical protein
MKRRRDLVMSISLESKLFIYMEKKKTNKLSTFKKKKPFERKVADDLVRLHERNEKLRNKEIGTSFLDLF